MARNSGTLSFKDGGHTSQGYALSLMLHVAIIAVAWTGLPFLQRELPQETPLIVDLVPIEELTSAAPPPTPDKAPEPVPVQPEPPKPTAAVDAPSPDTMPPPPKPEVAKKEPEIVSPPKVKPPPKPTPAKTKQDDIASLQKLLKDMQKNQPKPKQQAADSKAPPTNNVAPSISDHASMTELDAIRRHIEACWRIDPGKEGIENLSAVIKVFINANGSVREAQIVDMTRYFVDSAFRTFANSARNAVLACGNIPISAERYELFKEIDMNFSPQGRIN